MDAPPQFTGPGKIIIQKERNHRHVAEQQRNAIEVCEENRDSPTGNVLQEILDETEKRIWFLYEISTGGKNQY